VRAGWREQRSEPGGWNHRIMAIAACIAIVFGAWMAFQLGAVRTTSAWQESYVTSISSRVATIMRVGLGDHVHCAVFRKYPKQAPSIEALQQAIAPEYRDLLPALRAKVPGGMELAIAHQCRYHGRRFLHLAFRGHGQLLSLVIARKSDGESFEVEGLAPALPYGGPRVYAANAQKFQIAAFETGVYLVYTISDMGRQRNLEMMAALAPAVTEFLKKLS
jgi:hypothetical protein